MQFVFEAERIMCCSAELRPLLGQSGNPQLQCIWWSCRPVAGCSVHAHSIIRFNDVLTCLAALSHFAG
eukprot:3308462-Pyramimonas_sp.AAC.1